VIVVSDTSPITSLLQIGMASLLHDLFASVVVPEAVHAELMCSHSSLPAFIQTKAVRDAVKVKALTACLDLGEAEAIVLAEELHAELLLMDETLGRRIAAERGASVIGLLGVLLRAKRVGVVSAVKPIIDEVRDVAGFYVSDDVVASVLRQAGEL